jgi:hypothetical protein
MGIGPLESFAFPGVFTRTISESSSTTAAGDIRFPAFVGVGSEEVRVSDFELVRGSSAIADNLIIDEDETPQFVATSWTSKTFTVTNYPIVTGDGKGTLATRPQDVVALVNGESAAVSAVDALLGTVTLVTLPKDGDIIRCNYYFKRTDTYIQLEDLSDQVDGVATTFKVKSIRICKGDNGGSSATDDDINATVDILYDPTPGATPGDEFKRTVRVFQVFVDELEAIVDNLDGANATFHLTVAPTAGQVVTVTYFTNTWQDTYDILPAAVVSRLVKVGLSQDTADFSIGSDCVLSGDNRIHWGQSSQTVTGVYSTGSDPLIDDISTGLRDDRVYGKLTTPLVVSTTNKTFVLPTQPVDGTGKGEPTEDYDLSGGTGIGNVIRAYVGVDWNAALSNEVTITKVRGTQITLATAPAVGENVYATYFENNLVDDIWTITNKVPGGANVGKYTIVSRNTGTALAVVRNGGSVTPVYAGAGAYNVMVDPLKASVERVTITFGINNDFTVTSKVGPAFTVAGRTGSVTTTGYMGQTFIDQTTGFRVTFSSSMVVTGGDTVIYDIGNPTVSTAAKYYITVDFGNPETPSVYAVPGINVVVSTTSGGTVDNTDDTVLLYTFNKSGNEPANGDGYYVSFDRTKTDYSIQFLTDMRTVIKNFGPIDINNPLVIAANLAFLNGARAVALKQIQKAAGQTDATVQSYIDGIDEFNEPLPNGLRPALMQALSTNAQVHTYLKSSNAIQSSIRYRNERTSIIGFAVGTTPDAVIQEVKALGTEKLTAIYPDAAVIGIDDAYGNTVEYLVDGSMIAAAVAGLDVSPAFDIATSLTRATITGFNRLYRRLDSVTAALVANAGCTVLEEVTPVIRVMFYLTTDLSTPLTRDPRIVEIKHFVQQGLRNVLDRYIGVKNLPSVMPQIQATVGSYFRSLKQADLITDYKPAVVTQSDVDPSTLNVECFYSPVFPVNWIVVTINLRNTI